MDISQSHYPSTSIHFQGDSRPNLIYEHGIVSQVKLCSITLKFSRCMFHAFLEPQLLRLIYDACWLITENYNAGMKRYNYLQSLLVLFSADSFSSLSLPALMMMTMTEQFLSFSIKNRWNRCSCGLAEFTLGFHMNIVQVKVLKIFTP